MDLPCQGHRLRHLAFGSVPATCRSEKRAADEGKQPIQLLVETCGPALELELELRLAVGLAPDLLAVEPQTPNKAMRRGHSNIMHVSSA